MKKMFLVMVTATSLQAQKPPIDASAYDKWPELTGSAAISNNGKFVCYTIANRPVSGQTLVLQATQGNWKMEVSGVTLSSCRFTQDSRRAVFTKDTDSLGLVVLGSSSIAYISNVASFKLSSSVAGEWLAYQLNSSAKDLVVRNLDTSRQQSFTAVMDYVFSEDGSVLVVRTASSQDSALGQSLKWMCLADSTTKTIWQGAKAGNIVFDASSTQLAFVVEDTVNNQTENSFWYFKAGTDTAALLVSNHSSGLDSGLRLDNITGFSEDGSRVFFSLKEKDGPRPNPDAVQVHVWSYMDAKLQSQQLKDLGPRSYAAVVHIQDHRIVRLEQENERSGGRSGDVVLVHRSKGGAAEGEWNWNAASQRTTYLVSTKDGTRKQIKENTQLSFSLSPEEKYLVYYDDKQKNFFSYDVASGVTRNVTRGIAVTWVGYARNDLPTLAARGIAGWVKGDAAVLLYDRNDLWRVDPTGRQLPVNLTNGYGRRHNIIFYLGMDDYSHRAIANNEKLILAAFDRTKKDNGFYSKVLHEKGDPELLTMAPYVYHAPTHAPLLGGASPVKARDAEAYLVRRMSATEFPNYFSTADFKTFARLSDLEPEKDYNWLRTELHAWKTLDGSTSQGILYKPENFDPKKNYPIIFNYYEILSDRLNTYITPEALSSACALNIPWFVSNGYLVFTPDIHFTVGEPGESVVSAVVSAAKHLAAMPWVDDDKMGIQGCSFGGFATNYLVTHTKLFAAAVSSSGISDLISDYGSLLGSGESVQSVLELGQLRIGASLWQRPDLYIKNSPIFRADKVTTPLLMMHTTMDGSPAPFPQAVELFTALRRLGKKAWLLQYEDGNHGVWGKSAADFGVRMAQFFNHYLKGAPAPKWMTQGIPAKMERIDDGLELDHDVVTPGPGLVAEPGVAPATTSSH